MPVTKHTIEVHLLSQIVLGGECSASIGHLALPDEGRRSAFQRVAQLHHVVVRAFRPLAAAAAAEGKPELANWASEMLSLEEIRIANVLSHAEAICRELEQAGLPVLVIKSLDHWPDIGNDLDLYTSAGSKAVRTLLERKFRAVGGPRTWGDRLAGKCGYRVPGLRATVEVHHGRLGQTGEHRALAQRFLARRMPAQFLNYSFMVPAPEERVIAAALQRMYRHFYFRICDIANTGKLIERGELDYAKLRWAAQAAGIWPGVSSYLSIVVNYIRKYRSAEQQDLPSFVLESASVGEEELFIRGPWLRVPVLASAGPLYGRQLTTMLLNGDWRATFRLSLLPPLASVAKMAYLVTGNHRGIW